VSYVYLLRNRRLRQPDKFGAGGKAGMLHALSRNATSSGAMDKKALTSNHLSQN
jgi:hypothetical protein